MVPVPRRQKRAKKCWVEEKDDAGEEGEARRGTPKGKFKGRKIGRESRRGKKRGPAAREGESLVRELKEQAEKKEDVKPAK